MNEAKPQPYKVRSIRVETRDPPARHDIGVGQFVSVTPPTVHHVSNPSAEPCRFLLVQDVGEYDFVKARA